MKWTLRQWPLLLGLILLFAPAAGAQTHFRDCTTSRVEQATILIRATTSASLDGNGLAPGDEIAVFTGTGACAGAMVWTGQSAALTVWGNDTDTLTAEETGLRVEEVMQFRVWDASAQVEYGRDQPVLVTYSDRAAYLQAHGRFVPNGIYELVSLTGVTRTAAEAPEALPPAILESNVPNPFPSRTRITYHLAAEAMVRIEVFNAQGQYIRTLAHTRAGAGAHEVHFDGTGLSGGVYFYRLTLGDAVLVRPMLLVR